MHVGLLSCFDVALLSNNQSNYTHIIALVEVTVKLVLDIVLTFIHSSPLHANFVCVYPVERVTDWQLNGTTTTCRHMALNVVS